MYGGTFNPVLIIVSAMLLAYGAAIMPIGIFILLTIKFMPMYIKAVMKSARMLDVVKSMEFYFKILKKFDPTKACEWYFKAVSCALTWPTIKGYCAYLNQYIKWLADELAVNLDEKPNNIKKITDELWNETQKNQT